MRRCQGHSPPRPEGLPAGLAGGDIQSDQSLHDRYKEIIPVMVIDGQITIGARVEEEELRDALMEVESTNRTEEVRKVD